MKVCVVGLWHLGTVIAACVASGGHEVVGLDFDERVVSDLSAGTPPVSEPGLADLVKAQMSAGRLTFTTDPNAVASTDVLWVAYDTPVDDEDRADVDYVVGRVERLFPLLKDGMVVLVSSQLPVGTTRRLEDGFARQHRGRRAAFAYSPENLRLGKAISVFRQPDRVVVGARSPAVHEVIAALFEPFTNRIEWMSVESAEMTKHALNAFLATSVTFINEIAGLCEQVGADASEVERGLKSESRIGPGAYLSPGAAFAGGTLARDVVFLSQLGRSHGVAADLLSSVKTSNDVHRRWARQRLEQLLAGVSGKTVAIWGLTYKAGTDTLRRSSSVELCEWLADTGATVRAHDPAIKALPPGLAERVHLADNPASALDGASALVIATPWPQFRDVAVGELAARMVRRLVLDANCFTSATLGRDTGIEYVSVGRSVA